MSASLRVLILEDRPADAELMLHELRRAGYEPDWRRVETEPDYVAHLEPTLDVILADYNLPQFDALRALHLLQERDLDIPFIVVTGTVSEEAAVKCMQQGATDYLLKDRLGRLGSAVERALQQKHLRDEKRQAEDALRESEEKYRSLFESSPESITLISLDGTVLDCNEATTMLAGSPRDSLIGRSFTEIGVLDAENLPRMAEHFSQIADGQAMEPLQLQIIRGGSETRWIEVFPVLLKKGSRAYAIQIISRDITERKQAEDALRRRVEELAALQATVLEITAPHDLPTLLRTIVERAVLLLNASGGGLYLCDPTHREVRCVVSYNTLRDYTGTVLKYGEGAAGIVAQSGQPLIVSDYRSWSGRASVYEKEQPFSSVLSAPMVWQGQVTGVIHVLHTVESRRFAKADLELLTLFANHAAIAVENTRLYEAVQQELAERRQAEQVQAALYRISEATQSAQNLDGLYRSIHAIISELMPAKNFYIAIYDQVTDLLIFPYHADELDGEWPPVRSGKSLTGYVLRTGKPLLATPQVFDQLVESDQIELIGTPSVDWLGVPLKTAHGMIGVMAVQTYTEAARLSEDDKDVLVFVSTQVAMAIERKQSEEALRKSQALLRAIIENLPFEFWACGSDGRYLMQNAPDIKLWGNLIGKTLEEIGLPEDELAVWRANHRRAFAGDSVRGEHARTIEGEKKYYDSIIGPIRDGEMIIGILGIRIDITERKQAEEQIKKLNRMLRVMNEANQALVRAVDEIELLQHVCQIIVQVGGYRLAWVGWAEQDEARAVRPVAAAGHDEGYVSIVNITWADDERGRGPTGTAIRTAQPAMARNILTDPFYAPWRERAVQRGYASSIALPLSASGLVLGALNIYAAEPDAFDRAEIRLLTEMADDLAYGIIALRTRAERQRAEEQIQRLNLDLERRARGLAALNQAGQIMASTLDLDTLLGRILTQVQGLLEAQAVSVMLATLTPDKTGEELVFAAATSPSSKSLIGARLPITAGIAGWVMRQGQSALVADAQTDPRYYGDIDRETGMTTRSVLAVPLIAKGSALGVIEAINKATGAFDQHDLEILEALSNSAAIAVENARLYATEQERAAALARALEQQRELDRLQREFIQNVSHELRTPLTIIRGHAEALDGGWRGKISPEQQDSIGVILRRSQMLSKLVDDITGVLEVERRELKREPIDLAQLVRTSLADFQRAVQQADLTLSAEIAPDLPMVSGDAIALRRVLDNLVGNACKFTPPGGRVTMRLWRSEDGVHLQVADTGIGIAPQHLERIFERFYQVDGSSTRRYGGIGLGLSLVKEIVEAHGGQVTVESQVGVGTTFTILLPGR